MIHKPTNKAHGRSKFSSGQGEYIASKLRVIVHKRKDMTANSLRKIVLKFANEYVQIHNDGNRIVKLGSTTVYDFLRKYDIPAPTKAKGSKTFSSDPGSHNLSPSYIDKIIDYHPNSSQINLNALSREEILARLEMHNQEITKIKAKLMKIDEDSSIYLNSDSTSEEGSLKTDEFICYQEFPRFNIGEDEINLEP